MPDQLHMNFIHINFSDVWDFEVLSQLNQILIQIHSCPTIFISFHFISFFEFPTKVPSKFPPEFLESVKYTVYCFF